MHIAIVPNRNSRPAILLRESCREDGKVRKRTLANLTRWPEHLVEGLRTLLRGGVAVAKAEDATACCATATAARSPSRCSTATPPIRARSATR